jgi:hypothetical protein
MFLYSSSTWLTIKHFRGVEHPIQLDANWTLVCNAPGLFLKAESRVRLVSLLIPNVRPCVTGHPAWRGATDTPQHNKRDNGLKAYKPWG